MALTAFTSSTSLGLSAMTPSRAVLSSSRSLEFPRYAVVPSRRAGLKVTMASESNMEKKKAKVNAVRTALEESMLLFAVPLDGLTVSQISRMKDMLPAGTSAACVKNSLMRLAVADSSWEPAHSLTKQSSLWFFVREDMKETVKVYKDFIKKEGREDEIRGGVFDGEYYDTSGVSKVSSLPTKKELITKIAIGIKAVPTKIARSIKAVPTKLGRAVKLAIADGDEESPAQSDASTSE